MELDRRDFVIGAGTVGATGLAGCLGGTGGGAEYNVGMVYAKGGLGDDSFNDMAHKGIQKAEEEFDLAFNNNQPESKSEVKTFQRQLAQSTDPDYDLVSAIGFVQVDGLKENAPKFPDQNFMLVDSVAENEDGDLIPNVANYTFKEHEGSFQVGYLAGLLTGRDFGAGAGSTKPGEKTLGFVGGLEIPLIKKFEAGFKAGANHADGDVEVRAAYTGSWSDTTKGKEIATSMYDEGADIVYHAAGGAGNGVFQAAQERGRFAIGVDSDQSVSASSYKDVILASMVKHVDTAVYESAEAVVNGNFEGGTVHALGLEKDGVEAVYGQQLGSEISSGVKDKLDESRQSIVDGDISVPTDPKKV